MNPIESMIRSLAPERALRRFEARKRLELAEAVHARALARAGLDPSQGQNTLRSLLGRLRARRYEGAAISSRTAGWTAGHHSANAEIAPVVDRLRNRSRDLVRNNGWAARAVRHIQTCTVGSVGMVPSASSREGDEKRGRELVDLWNEVMGSTEIDPAGKLTFPAMQSLAVRGQIEAGEVLIRRRWRRDGDGQTLPFQLQMIEADHIDTAKFGDYGKNQIFYGVEFSPIGSLEAYWLFDTHPGEALGRGDYSMTSKRVPARDIAHFFEPLRIGQVRGVPRGCPVLIRHRDQADYDDATLVRAKIAALTVAFVTKPFDEDVPSVASAGSGENVGSGQLPVEEMVPGMLEYLAPGESVEFNNPISHDSIEEFSRVTCRQIAAGWGISYEGLTGDLSNVNFSSAKIGRITEAAELDAYRRLWFVPQVCDPVWKWFQEAAQLKGLVEPGRIMPASWTPPRREMIQPEKEINAMKAQIDAGLLTPSEALRQLGYNPRHVLDELKADLAALDQAGVKPSLLVRLVQESSEDSSDQDDPEIPTGTEDSRRLAVNGARAIAGLGLQDA